MAGDLRAVLLLSFAWISQTRYSDCPQHEWSSILVGDPIGWDSRNSWKGNTTSALHKALRTSRWRHRKCGGPVFKLPENLHRESGAVIAVHHGHDANIAIAIDGRVQCVLELERLFLKRYFHPSLTGNDFREQMLQALQVVALRCECEGGACPTRFETGVLIDLPYFKSPGHMQIPSVVEEVFEIKQWRHVHHHEAHALLGYYASPFSSALVVSYDGGGDDGYFNVFLARGHKVVRIARHNALLASFYVALILIFPEVSCYRQTHPILCEGLKKGSHILDNGWFRMCIYSDCDALTAAGKLMGYSGVGHSSPRAKAAVSLFADAFLGNISATQPNNHTSLDNCVNVPEDMMRMSCESSEGQESLALEVQNHFQQRIVGLVRDLLKEVSLSYAVEGIVMVGGAALNVLANQQIRDTLTQADGILDGMSNAPRDIYVPPAPNDAGIGIGALWAVQPPRVRQQLQYLGFRLWDEDLLEPEARRRGASQLSQLGGISYLAELLSGGPAWMQVSKNSSRKPIIAVVRGRQEFGPRALGHRSLLAVPDSSDVKKQLNSLKFRQWYRPVAPMIAEEALVQVFGRTVRSPTMELAPAVLAEVQKQFPALAHLDGTARHQSVAHQDEPWVHALLLAVAQQTGLAALINTSFNSRGKPICNSVSESLSMLDTLPDLDYVLIEDWLFRAPDVKKPLPQQEQRNMSIMPVLPG